MKNVFGNQLTVTLFGESHGCAVGAVLDGLTPGLPVDPESIKKKLSLRRPSDASATGRSEPDGFEIVSGVFDGKTTGTPLCLLIRNVDADSSAYEDMRGKARPGHADYPAFAKYHGFEDYRGSGHFSGRVTAALVGAGAIVSDALAGKGIRIGTHIASIGGVFDRPFDENDPDADIAALAEKNFAVLSAESESYMKEAIAAAKADGDSLGGVLETVVTGLPAGIGEPWFDTVEGMLAHALFSVPAVKGVEFGDGFALASLCGSQSNDAYRAEPGEDGTFSVRTATNRQGGIGGGVTNGMPLLFRCAVKPTPSIAKEQDTVDFLTGENVKLSVGGRHDACIVPRARAVIDAVTALTVADLYLTRFGTDALL